MVDGTATAAGGRLTEEQEKEEEKPGGAMEETCAVPLEIPAGRAIPDPQLPCAGRLRQTIR